MLGLLLGNLKFLLCGPLAIGAGIATIVAVCGCIKCLTFQIRDCRCIKWLLRFTGHDEFDDFKMRILVHDAILEQKDKSTTAVRFTAGQHSVKTNTSSSGIFQESVHVIVEQGAEEIIVDLLDNRSNVLATLKLDIMKDLMDYNHDLIDYKPETVYAMKPMAKGIMKPKLKLTIVVDRPDDVEKGLLEGMNSDVDFLVRQQLNKAKQEGLAHGDEALSEMEVLKQAASGPLEVFEGLGKMYNVFVAVLGPPFSRRWVLGIWNDQKDFEANKHAIQEIDLTKIETVQGDPSRLHVFIVNCFDDSRVRKSLTFRRIDRARDVWVEILHLLVTKARDAKKASKSQRLKPQVGVPRPGSPGSRGRAKTFGTLQN